MNSAQLRSRISSGHRLIRLVRERCNLYSHREFMAKAIRVPADYWLAHFTSSLNMRMNDAIARRINAAVARARSRANLYDVKKVGVAECATETLFDNWWFKPREANLSRIELRNLIKRRLDKGAPLRLHFPIFSRKPLCPLKNRGPNPDLAELHTLVRCAEAAQVINAISPTGCRLIILADGFKYNRACRTPDPLIAAYQDGLRFWVNQLNSGDIVEVVNYERLVSDRLSSEMLQSRQTIYEHHCASLAMLYDPLFDPDELQASLDTVQQVDDIGAQIHFTFWSIVSSTYYKDMHTLIGGEAFMERHYGDDVQKLYIRYASCLHRPLSQVGLQGEHLSRLGYLPPAECAILFRSMRRQAWEAALYYVAISLTDRGLNLLRRVDRDAIKLTVHAKKGELQFLSATRQDASITAQHCTGGLSIAKMAAKVNFRYRLERESQGEYPILLEQLPDTPFHREHYGPLHAMQMIDQPIGYTTDPRLIGDGRVHSILTRRG
ncbi:hypothetical protein CO676_24135 [Sinorhizobium sp. BJ1]|nr:hypothetical protein CO676_24135 [Sinorhizobium sp. BJ1]